MTADSDPSAALPLRELLLHLLEYTATDVIDELWPDNETTLDDIAEQILARHARELTKKQRGIPMGAPEARRIRDLVADAIDPDLINSERPT